MNIKFWHTFCIYINRILYKTLIINIMIEINDISKVFRTTEVETVALNHVNLEVKESAMQFRLWQLSDIQMPENPPS